MKSIFYPTCALKPRSLWRMAGQHNVAGVAVSKGRQKLAAVEGVGRGRRDTFRVQIISFEILLKSHGQET